MLWKWVNTDTQVFILDLDGTMMPSAEIDNECFWQAVFECYGGRDQLPDLHGFKHVTDTGVFNEWCAMELGRSPRADETRQIKHRFGQLLESAFKREPAHVSPLPGVEEWLDATVNHAHVHVGIATGGWKHSAQLKLQLSGLSRFDLPLASSDDATARTEIMQIAVQRTLGCRAGKQADLTYVGDGVWDLEASRELGWKFIGIASGKQASLLRLAGAEQISQNFCQSHL